MTGWRLGYALGPAAIIKQMQKLQSQSTSNPTSIIQKAAVAALRESQACVNEMREDYIRLRERIVTGLRAIPGIECQHPDGAFYAFPNVSKFFGRAGMNSAADVAGNLLREAHVVTVPGEAFGSPSNIRLSYATSAKEIDRGLDRMRTFFAKL
jgi:aspartate aminotransferase